MKKFLVSAVAAVSFLGLAACSDNSKDANKAPESTPPAAAPAPAPAAPSTNDTTTTPSTPAPTPAPAPATPGTGTAPAN